MTSRSGKAFGSSQGQVLFLLARASLAMVLVLCLLPEARGEDGVVILQPRGLWVSRMVGDVHAGRDGLTGRRLDFEDRFDGLGLDTELLASPYAELEFPGTFSSSVSHMLGIKFWWLQYDGTSRATQNFTFNRTVFQAGQSLETDLSVLSLQLRWRLDLSFELGSLPLIVSPTIGWSVASHDVKIKDPFDGTGKDRKKIEGTWPLAGGRITFQPASWFGVFVEGVGTDFAWRSEFGIRVAHWEARGGVLFRFNQNWGLVVEYSYTFLHLERGRRSAGRAEIDGTTSGPAMAIYAKF